MAGSSAMLVLGMVTTSFWVGDANSFLQRGARVMAEHVRAEDIEAVPSSEPAEALGDGLAESKPAQKHGWPAWHSKVLERVEAWKNAPLPMAVLKDLVVAPPSPYTYGSFMTWIRSANFTGTPGVKWVPEPSEYDIDAAVEGKFKAWLNSNDTADVVSVAKSINKWLFLLEMVRTGETTQMAIPSTHLYILQMLYGHARESHHPTFLDVGCGTGYLLKAWTLLAGNNSRAVGVDICASTIAAARNALDDPGNVDQATRLPKNVRIDVHIGDVLHPDATAWGLEPGKVDAINVGVAVESIKDLDPLIILLSRNGAMVVPLCKEEQPHNMTKGSCDAEFTILRKAHDGVSLEPMPGDPGVGVRFIVARQAPPTWFSRWFRWPGVGVLGAK